MRSALSIILVLACLIGMCLPMLRALWRGDQAHRRPEARSTDGSGADQEVNRA